MPEHHGIMRFRVSPAPFGKADPSQFVDHVVAVVRELSRRLPLELVERLECSFSVLKAPPPVGTRPIVEISIRADAGQEPITFASGSYQAVMEGSSLLELPDVEQFTEKLEQYLLRSLQAWMDGMARLGRVFHL